MKDHDVFYSRQYREELEKPKVEELIMVCCKRALDDFVY
jgi:hypothetical protein